MSMSGVYTQPAFPEQIAEAANREFLRLHEEAGLSTEGVGLGMITPDYSRPIDMKNLYRTTIAIVKSAMVGGGQVHISNMLYGPHNDTVVAVYENQSIVTEPQGYTRTRHYQPAAAMLGKTPVEKITHYSQDVLPLHIATFLFNREMPK